jgi:hypothetical protein
MYNGVLSFIFFIHVPFAISYDQERLDMSYLNLSPFSELIITRCFSKKKSDDGLNDF